jgi:hypothetical protein
VDSVANNVHASEVEICVNASEVHSPTNSVDVIASTVKFTEKAVSLYETISGCVFQLEQLNIDEFNAVLDGVSSVAKVIVPSLMEISKTVPFAGPATVVLMQFYGSVKLALENRDAVESLIKVVDQTATWFQTIGKGIEKMKVTNSDSYVDAQMNECLKNLVESIGACNNMFELFAETNSNNNLKALFSFTKRIFFSENDKNKLQDFKERIKSNRNELIQYYVLHMTNYVTTERSSNGDHLVQLVKLLESPYVSFKADIDEHAKRFINGSREWMASVSDDMFFQIFVTD